MSICLRHSYTLISAIKKVILRDKNKRVVADNLLLLHHANFVRPRPLLQMSDAFLPHHIARTIQTHPVIPIVTVNCQGTSAEWRGDCTMKSFHSWDAGHYAPQRPAVISNPEEQSIIGVTPQ